MATIIDALVVTLKLDNRGFSNEVKKATAENDRLSAAIDNVSDSSADLTITIKNQADETKKAAKKQDDFTKSINNGIKAIGALFATIMASSGLSKLISEIQKSNDQLYFLSKNLGMSATEIKKWQNMAEMSGGSADGMAASMSNLSKSLWDLVTIGDSSVLPYFNALNVGVVDSGGKLRDLDAILLDVADSLSGMSRPQAYNIAKNMGFDEGTINTLLQGRDAMQEMLDTQRGLVISSEEELEISRQLNKQNAQVRQGWEGLKTLLANYLMPSLLKFSEMVTGVLMFLNKNRDTAVTVFKGIGIVLGVLLIPMVIKAATAFLGMFGAIGLVPLALLALGSSLWLLYDDFKKWKSGGESLLGEYWKKWDETITPIVKMLDDFKDWFKDTTIGKWFTDQDGNLETWKVALGAFGMWFAGKWVVGITAGLLKIGAGFTAMFGWPGLLVAGLVTALGIWQMKLNELDLSPLMVAAAEAKIKFDDLTKSINMFRDAKNGIDKVQAGIRAGSEIIPGGNIFKAGIDNKIVDKVIDKVRKDGFLKSVNDAAVGAYSYLAGAKSGDTSVFTASGVEVPNQNKRIYKTANGDIVREGGSRSWRNNNPGNIIAGDYADSMGAIGRDKMSNGHIMAIFPTEEMGRAAKEQLIFRGASYKNLKLSDAISRYAPEFNSSGKRINDTPQYIKNVLAAVGGSEKAMKDYTPSEQKAIIAAMKNTEDWRAGNEYAVGNPKKLDSEKLLSHLISFNEQISQPLTPNAMPGIQQTMANSQALQSGSKSVTYNITAPVENLNVNTTSPTISGTVGDGSNAWRENLFQTITPMS
ncbi:lytic transglycosylase, catalytic [Klebsiella pneumoniae]|nr:lytic transglycosylase, catalytic [Klebsiella pneumoniae]